MKMCPLAFFWRAPTSVTGSGVNQCWICETLTFPVKSREKQNMTKWSNVNWQRTGFCSAFLLIPSPKPLWENNNGCWWFASPQGSIPLSLPIPIHPVVSLLLCHLPLLPLPSTNSSLSESLMRLSGNVLRLPPCRPVRFPVFLPSSAAWVVCFLFHVA